MSDDPKKAATDRYSITIWHRSEDGAASREAFLDDVPDAERAKLAQAIAPSAPTVTYDGWQLTLTRLDGTTVDAWSELPDEAAAMFRDCSALQRRQPRGRRR